MAKPIHKSHSLNDVILDDNGVVGKYGEFHKIDFDNSFVELEKPDYEIRASENDEKNQNKEDLDMKGTREKRVASYIGQLSSGYDAKVQDDYEAGKNDQEGKAHEEEVAKKNNWKSDKRDAVNRAASTLLKRTAAKLVKMADMYAEENDELDEDKLEDEDFEDLDLDVDEEEKEADEKEEEIDECELTSKKAAHPLEHDIKKDDPKADMDAQTGDDEWVDIGSGSFKDKRDDVGRAK